jgi:hypothetical protein
MYITNLGYKQIKAVVKVVRERMDCKYRAFKNIPSERLLDSLNYYGKLIELLWQLPNQEVDEKTLNKIIKAIKADKVALDY